MSAKRVTKSAIDWVAFAARVSEDQLPQYRNFKAKCDSYLRGISAHPEVLPKINWDNYASRIAIPGMVEEFKKQYEAVQVPYPKDTYTEKINEVEKIEMANVDKFVQESKGKAAKAMEELKRWENMIPITLMTQEEFVENLPDLAFDIHNPTVYPHTPDVQPGYVPPEGSESETH